MFLLYVGRKSQHKPSVVHKKIINIFKIIITMEPNSGIPIEFLSPLRRVEVEAPAVYDDSFNTNNSWCYDSFSDGEDDRGGRAG